ncbi:MAG: hypothetical protein QOJ09_882 [Actinomycetota bacterium]|nr:hypothetical protein [Actinomycetota bacterium]
MMAAPARRVAAVAGAATAALTFGLALGLHDRDALLLTVGLGLAVGLAVRRPMLGGVALAVLLVDVAAWMGLALLSHLRHDDAVASLVISLLLVVSSVAGLAALAVEALSRGGVGAARRPARPFLAAVLGVGWGVAAAVVVAVAPSAVNVPVATRDRLVVSIKNSRFSTEEMQGRAATSMSAGCQVTTACTGSLS